MPKDGTVTEWPTPPSLLDVPASGLTEMSEDEARVLVGLALKEQREPIRAFGANDPTNADLMTCFQFAVMAKRIPQRVFVTTNTLIFLLTLIGERHHGSPAACVMWIYTLTRMFDEKLKQADPRRISDLEEMITVRDLCTRFPDGFPTHEAMRVIWEQQKYMDRPNKIAPDNYLDYRQTWEPRP